MQTTMNKQTLWVMMAGVFLAACSTAPQRGPEINSTEISSTSAPIAASKNEPAGRGAYLPGDGPDDIVPVNLEATPDAVPQDEPLHPYANRPYVALGKKYTPLNTTGNYKKRGIASWYGKKFHGKPTAIGEKYDMYKMTAAHPTLPLPSYVRVTHLGNGKSVIVRVNDRGPFLHDRIIDLSYTAAKKLGIIGKGSSEVEVESIVVDSAVITPLNMESVLSEPLAPELGTNISTETARAGNTYIQLGAFKSKQAAEEFVARMRNEFEGSGKTIDLYQKEKESDLVRVHLGPYASQEDARLAADKMESRLGFKPMVSSR